MRDASAERDYFRYKLLDEEGVVYYGATTDPPRQEAEHRADGWVFTEMSVNRYGLPKDAAQKWVKKRLAVHRRKHGGKEPKYNR